jgi:hypothetical protein
MGWLRMIELVKGGMYGGPVNFLGGGEARSGGVFFGRGGGCCYCVMCEGRIYNITQQHKKAGACCLRTSTTARKSATSASYPV